jgi:hypothetical protein
VVRFINWLGPLGQILGLVAGAFLTLTTATTLYNIAQSTSIKLAAQWAATLLGPVVSAIVTVNSWVLTYTGSMLAATAVTAAFIGILTGGLALALAGINSMFSDLTTNIGKARKELQNFQNENISDRGPSFAQEGGMGAEAVYRDNSTTVINANGKDSAAREQYRTQFEKKQRIDSIFGQ